MAHVIKNSNLANLPALLGISHPFENDIMTVQWIQRARTTNGKLSVLQINSMKHGIVQFLLFECLEKSPKGVYILNIYCKLLLFLTKDIYIHPHKQDMQLYYASLLT